MDAFHGLCDGYLVKPIAKAELLELIGKLIPQNRAA
jgi:YesN/AraC family two-component response regulator